MSDTENPMEMRVLHVKEGREILSSLMPYDEAKELAKALKAEGCEVLSIMDEVGAQRYLDARRPTGKAAIADQLDSGKTFPVEAFQKVNRDVGPEVDDSLEVGATEDAEEDTEKPPFVIPARVQRRHLAMELALEMYGSTADERSSNELVNDARTILAFLEG